MGRRLPPSPAQAVVSFLQYHLSFEKLSPLSRLVDNTLWQTSLDLTNLESTLQQDVVKVSANDARLTTWLRQIARRLSNDFLTESFTSSHLLVTIIPFAAKSSRIVCFCCGVLSVED